MHPWCQQGEVCVKRMINYFVSASSFVLISHSQITCVMNLITVLLKLFACIGLESWRRDIA